MEGEENELCCRRVLGTEIRGVGRLCARRAWFAVARPGVFCVLHVLADVPLLEVDSVGADSGAVVRSWVFRGEM